MKLNEITRAKSHFASHYPSLINYYGGSLISYSSQRYERKNKEVKNLITHSKNFKDVAYSLSWLHQAKRITVNPTCKIIQIYVPDSFNYRFNFFT